MPELFLISQETLKDFEILKDNFRSIPTLKIAAANHTEPLAVAPGYNRFNINGDLLTAIDALAKKFDLPRMAVLSLSFQTLLYRYTGQEDTLITHLCTNQNQGNTTGYLADYSHFDNHTTFASLLQLRQTPHWVNRGLLTYEQLEGFLKDIETGCEVLQTFISYQECVEVVDKTVIETALLPFKNFHIGLFLSATPNGLKATLVYNSVLLSNDFAHAFQQHYINLLQAVTTDPGKHIAAYQLLTDEEWQATIIDFNNTIVPYPKARTLFSFFEEQAAALPNQIALRKHQKNITYADLNKQANQLAHYLINEGVLPGDNISLMTARDFDMIVGMLGILKAGGAYVPIDPDYPIDRQEYIYGQSSVKMIIADKHYPIKSLLGPEQYYVIDADELTGYPTTNPGVAIDSRQLAYTIYTSGSTGRPKGVMIEHHSAVNLCLWVNKTYHVGSNDTLLFITSMCFDLSVYDIFGMLAAGGCIVIAEQQEIQDVKQLQKMLNNYKITFWDSVPTTIDYLIRNLELTEPEYRCNSLKTLFMSGDWIAVDLPERIKKFMPQTRVVSLGGATEGTVWSNYFEVKETLKNWRSIPYGKPIDNNFYYILNSQLQPVPMGVVGNLYIGGAGVARGYAADQEKTDASFIPDPFNNELGGMMYRTGDLGRMGPDMNMEFMGRADNQVKISGFRVELGEIESVLNSCELVNHAVVLAKDDAKGKKQLVAYVVFKGTPDKNSLNAHLKSRLPNYMVPSIWITLDELPLTSNGKIDRKNLPEAEEVTQAKKSVSAATGTEKILKSIWQDCMGLSELSVEDNFFEIGGHSLIAAQILSIFKNETGHNLQLAILFEYPDIRSLAKFIDSKRVEDKPYTCLVPMKTTGTRPPLYIIHGEGLNVLKFSPLVSLIDHDQPVWGLQARGLNGIDQPMDNMQDIAKDYLSEILQHNPEGPYYLAGYSFGGYVAVEIQKLLNDMGKEADTLIMFDTDSERMEKKLWYKIIFKKIIRNTLRFPAFVKAKLAGEKGLFKLTGKLTEKRTGTFYAQISQIRKQHTIAFRNYKLTDFDAKVILFKAQISVHYPNDTVTYGWKRFAKKGVEVVDVPGDHLSMLEHPHVNTLAKALQQQLDKLAFKNTKPINYPF